MAPALPFIGGALLGGIGSYFGGKANESGAKTSAESNKYGIDKSAESAAASLAEQKRQALIAEAVTAQKLADEQQAVKDAAATKVAAGGIISSGYDTSGYDKTLNYIDPYATGVKSAIDTLLAGGLTGAETAQRDKGIAAGEQTVRSNAATMGLPAGARALLSGQNMSDIMNNYAVMGSGRVEQGISAAGSATQIGAEIAKTNYDSALQNFLTQQGLKNRKTELMAANAVPANNLDAIKSADAMTKYSSALAEIERMKNM
jgi:hypothetical protein